MLNLPSEAVANKFVLKGENFTSHTGPVCPLNKGTVGESLVTLLASNTETQPPPPVDQDNYKIKD